MPSSKSAPDKEYRLLFAKKMRKEFRKLDPDTQSRIKPKLYDLKDDPRPSGVKKLTGHNSLYRIRVGDYRVIYRINDEKITVYVLRVRHRSEVYRGL